MRNVLLTISNFLSIATVNFCSTEQGRQNEAYTAKFKGQIIFCETTIK